MRNGIARVVVVTAVMGLTLGATPAYKREKKSEFSTYRGLVAAHYLACPEIFGDVAVARYLAADSSRKYTEYLRAKEFDPARREALLQETRDQIRALAVKAYQPEQVTTLKDVEIHAGTYDLARKGIEFQFPRSIGVGGTLPTAGDRMYPWAELREGAALPPAVVSVTPEFPREAPFAWDATRRLLFVPVDRAAAEEFATAYPPGSHVNLGNGGVRLARAYVDIQVMGCYSDPLGASFMRGVRAKVVGFRLYSMSSYNRSAGDLVYEWAEGK